MPYWCHVKQSKGSFEILLLQTPCPFLLYLKYFQILQLWLLMQLSRCQFQQILNTANFLHLPFCPSGRRNPRPYDDAGRPSSQMWQVLERFYIFGCIILAVQCFKAVVIPQYILSARTKWRNCHSRGCCSVPLRF